MFRKVFFLGLTVGITTALTAYVYNRVYIFALEVNFSKIVNTGSIIGVSFAVSMIIAILYWFMKRWLKQKGEIVFNFTLTILSFAAIYLPVSISLPLDISNPELFMGLVVPMLFFPALGWHTLKPLFIRE